MSEPFEERCRSLLRSLGLCRSGQALEIRRLSGGVASDIAAVTAGERTVCVKFALEKLRVDEEWFAPVRRGKAEFAWLQFAGSVVPAAVPALHGWSDAANGFAMEYLAGPDVLSWKSDLMAAGADRGEAAALAEIIGRIHARSTAPGFDRGAFDNGADFDALRTDPYLRFTIARHPDLSRRLNALADRLSACRIALVHGDVSPKNVLLRDGRPVLLDAECASMGDPAFDVAFCLNHLLIKSIHLPASGDDLLRAAEHLWQTYSPHVVWEDVRGLEARAAALLPALMLARVDGKSPVEYLSARDRNRIRALARPLVATPADHLRTVFETVQLASQP